MAVSKNFVNLVVNGDFQGTPTAIELVGGVNLPGVVIPAGALFTRSATTIQNKTAFTQPAVSSNVTVDFTGQTLGNGTPIVAGANIHVPSGLNNDVYLVVSTATNSAVLQLVSSGVTAPGGTVAVNTTFVINPVVVTSSAAYTQPAIGSTVVVPLVANTVPLTSLVVGQGVSTPDGGSADFYWITAIAQAGGFPTSITLQLKTVAGSTTPFGLAVATNAPLINGWTLNANIGGLQGNNVQYAFTADTIQAVNSNLEGQLTAQVPGFGAFEMIAGNTNQVLNRPGTLIQLQQVIAGAPKAISGKLCHFSLWFCAARPGFIGIGLNSTVSGAIKVLSFHRQKVFAAGIWQEYEVDFVGPLLDSSTPSDSLQISISLDDGGVTNVGILQSVGITGVNLQVPINDQVYDAAFSVAAGNTGEASSAEIINVNGQQVLVLKDVVTGAYTPVLVSNGALALGAPLTLT